jgi:PEP-CTERM motif
MSTRIKTTAGAIITIAMLGTLLPVVNSAQAEESEFCDPVETVSPAKQPRKVIKAKAPRKASAQRAPARKVVAAKTGVKKVAKLVKAKPKKPMSFADRLRNKARRMMLAALDPKKAKMCRPRTQDQLGLLDKMQPAAGELPSGGGTPFKFTPDTSIGSLANLSGRNDRIFNPSRVGAYSIPGGGGGGGGSTSGGNTTPTGGSTSSGGSTSGGNATPTGGSTSSGGSTSGDNATPTGGSTSSGGSTSGGGTGCGADGGMPLDGDGIPGGAMNPMPGVCGGSSSGGGSTSGGAQVAEPGALSLFGLGLLAACWQRRRKA